jgi:hypothetical protein
LLVLRGRVWQAFSSAFYKAIVSVNIYNLRD